MDERSYYVYINTNKWNSVLYTGVANNLIKGGSRKKKLDLIKTINPKWRDLSEKISL